ncbi:MAG: YidC/Oxa1 family membrane protein insertase [Dehalococcoidia bacterium]|nr:YidC/Oxa1 family membrane protein insertase [Dehalococcoidia bacterium]
MDLFELVSWLWTHGLVIPMTNFLVLLSTASFGSFGLAIIIFTVVMRGLTWPLTQQQLRASRAMQAAQPRIQEIQKQYKDPKRRSEETMKVYREVGFSPLGCIWPMLIQFPIWIALFQSIRFTLGATPESLLDLSQRLYPVSYLRTSVPLENHFLWLDLAQPDSTLLMAILVGASTWVQQRMTTPTSASADSQQAQVNRTMLLMMPLMFAFFTLQFPSGLALYWVATNVIGIVLQFIYMGPGEFDWRRLISLGPMPTEAGRPAAHEVSKGGEAERAEEEPEEDQELTASARRRRRRRRGRRRR